MIRQFNIETQEWTEIADAHVVEVVLSIEQQRELLQPLSAWQVRKVLTQLGLRSQVETGVANADQDTKDAWQYAKEFERTSPVLVGMAQSLGISDKQLDDMFKLGITL